MNLRLRIRTLMVAVAVAAVATQVGIHARAVLRQEDDFAWVILVVEAYAALAALGVLWVVGLMWSIVRKDQEYVQQLDGDVEPPGRNSANSSAGA